MGTAMANMENRVLMTLIAFDTNTMKFSPIVPGIGLRCVCRGDEHIDEWRRCLHEKVKLIPRFYPLHQNGEMLQASKIHMSDSEVKCAREQCALH